MLRGQLLGLLRLPVLLAASVLLLLVTLLVVVSWRGLVRLEPVREHLTHLSLLQEATIAGERILAEADAAGRAPAENRLEAFRQEVADVVALGRQRAAETAGRLHDAVRLLDDGSVAPAERLQGAVHKLHEALSAERRAQGRLLQNIDRTAHVEFELASVLLVALPLAGSAVAYLLRDRIWRPLADLALLLDQLSLREYRRIPAATIADASPALAPVYRNYNMLVSRLRELEQEHHEREHTLEQEVREATAALLDLNRQLAESERLAAVGEVSAGLAHELRNPLAGIHLACTRLRGTLADPSQVERLNLVIGEIDRLNQLLAAQLAQARHTPEPPTEVAVGETLETLLSLVRYQVPEGVRIHAKVADDLRCRLPVGQLRQTLLNLVLNAAQAIGHGPGSIEVAARSENDDRLVITVCDDGPGFSPEVLAAPARAFVTAREGGTGLGLAIVRRFAQDLGGEVKLENLPPHGARVTVVARCEICGG